MTTTQMTSPLDLFLHELGDILYVERSLADEALPKLIDVVQDTEFKSGLEKHLEQTQRHVTNVERVFEILGETPHEEECIAFEGLKKEHEEMTKESSSSLNDLVDLGAAARTENYEIAAYEGLRRLAKALGHPTRVLILRRVRTLDGRTCSELVSELGLAQSTVSEHLRVLREAGLIHAAEGESARSPYVADVHRLRRLKALAGSLGSAPDRGVAPRQEPQEISRDRRSATQSGDPWPPRRERPPAPIGSD